MNWTLTRLLLPALAAVLLVPGVASARIVEIGQTTAAPAPSCPTSPCEVISRTTAFQTRVDGKRKLFVAPAAGRIVAWTITLGTPGRRQRRYFEENLGGPSQAGISVLRQGDRRYGRVTGESPVQNLTPYFGQTVQFPLAATIPINKGDVVALTVPTWAPALGLGLGPQLGLAREPRHRRVRRHADAERAGRRAGPHPLPLRVPHGARDLQRDAGHDAGAAESRSTLRSGRRRQRGLGAEQVQQRVDDLGVELRARAGAQLGDRVLLARARGGTAARRHRGVGVAGEDDARADRDLRPDRPSG